MQSKQHASNSLKKDSFHGDFAIKMYMCIFLYMCKRRFQAEEVSLLITGLPQFFGNKLKMPLIKHPVSNLDHP